MVFHEFKGRMAKCLEERPFGYWVTKCSRLWKPLGWTQGENIRDRRMLHLCCSCPPLAVHLWSWLGTEWWARRVLVWSDRGYPVTSLVAFRNKTQPLNDGSQRSPLAEVLPLQRTNYCISIINYLVFRTGGFGAMLLPSCVDPWQPEVLFWWSVWMECLIGGSNLSIWEQWIAPEVC